MEILQHGRARRYSGLVDAIRGLEGNAHVGRILATLNGTDRPDFRPPGICSDCFATWARTGRANVAATCAHHGCRAYRLRGRWIVEAIA